PARDQEARQAFQRKTGFAYIPDSDRDKRREVGDIGLVALTYYNHGVELTHARRYHEALVAYFRAMSLDPELASAVQNALAVLANWGVELAGQGAHEKALEVLATGLDLAPEDAALLHNRKVVWGTWAEAAMNEGRVDEAVARLRRDAAAVPDAASEFLA